MTQDEFDTMHVKSHAVGSNEALVEIADDALALGDFVDGAPESKARRKAVYDKLKALGGGTAPVPGPVPDHEHDFSGITGPANPI